jgi:Domain of Unknown Function (DUF1080)
MRNWFGLGLILALPSFGAEKKFDFSEVRENQTPPGFRSIVNGLGNPGDWKVILDEVPPLMPRLTAQASALTKQSVLAQLAQDPTDEHYPILIYEDEVYGDFTLTTRFKTVRGTAEQMAGIAFRIQNETNYYVVRASSLGKTFKFYRVVNGVRGVPVGADLPIPSGVWQEMTIACKDNQIRASLNGKELINLTDKVDPLKNGKIGFWTKSDSVSYFADTKIIYTPREPPAQGIVRDTVKKFPSLLDLKIYVAAGDPKAPRLVACKNEKDLGRPGGKEEQGAIGQGAIFYGKEKGSVSVIMPLRDRNGDSIAATLIKMKSFPGQTEQNALARAQPVLRELQDKVQSLQDLLE